MKLPYSPDGLQYGLFTLHEWIRFFEYSYFTRPVPNQKMHQRVEAFQQKMGLVGNYLKCGGSGISKDGNTARRDFSIEDALAEVTRINKELHDFFCISNSFISN